MMKIQRKLEETILSRIGSGPDPSAVKVRFYPNRQSTSLPVEMLVEGKENKKLVRKEDSYKYQLQKVTSCKKNMHLIVLFLLYSL